MDNQAALTLIRDILAPRQLSSLEEMVICYSWEGKRYREMAQSLGYEEGYLKDTGSRLWQSLSDSLGYPVSKKRLRYTLTEIVAKSQTPKLASKPAPKPASEPAPETVAAGPNVLTDNAPPEGVPLPELAQAMEYPGSPLSYGSPLYIQRPPVEKLAVAALQHPGGLLRINAPWRMGKTSLINHLLGEYQQLGYATVVIDVRQADTTALDSLDAFFRWFCWSINQQLNLTWALDKYWFEDAGSKLNCTTYMQEHILAQIESPLVIAIDTCHTLIDYPVIAKNFFAMLRSWHEQAKARPQWQKLRLVLAHVASLELPVQVHQSPFNVGLQVELTCFTSQQSHCLRERYSLGTLQAQEEVALGSLVELVGGQPYLMQLAFYWLKFGQLSLDHILQTAATNEGIYREYLRSLWLALPQEDVLIKAFCQVLLTPEPVCLSPEHMFALVNTRLVEMVGYKVKLRCELYRRYFSFLLEPEGR